MGMGWMVGIAKTLKLITTELEILSTVLVLIGFFQMLSSFCTMNNSLRLIISFLNKKAACLSRFKLIAWLLDPRLKV